MPKTNILIMTGGHSFEREAFFDMFNSFSDIEWAEAVQPKANELYASPLMDQYDALVFYDMVQEITAEQKAAFIKRLEKGKGVLFLHHSLASYQEWDEFEKIIGGHYHLESDSTREKVLPLSTYQHDVDIPVKIVDPEHPIATRLDDFVIHDEVYGNFLVLPEVHPLLSTSHPASGKIIGWTNFYGNSRIVYIQLGHDHHAYENPNYRRLVRQAIDWVINR